MKVTEEAMMKGDREAWGVVTEGTWAKLKDFLPGRS